MNSKRLKQQYHQPLKWRKNSWDDPIYPFLHSASIKKFSTKQEKSFYFMHSLECREYKVKLRAKRGKALAHVNDDLNSSAFDVARCWKNNSKRPKQYYR